MALITCPRCGRQVSDKAHSCPACNLEFPRIENTNQFYHNQPMRTCSECGMMFPNNMSTCPNCGCPAPALQNNTGYGIPQGMGIANTAPPSNKKKRNVVIGIILLAIIIVLSLVGFKIYSKKKAVEEAKEYEDNLLQFAILVLSGASDAESAGNLIHDVWYNCIWEESDITTDKYTKPNGYFYDDFNDALGNLFDDSNFNARINSIKSNQSEVKELMRKLNNPPDEYKDAYEAAKDLYDAYNNFTNMVISPSGSLSTFTSNFNDADSEVLNCFNRLQLYLE